MMAAVGRGDEEAFLSLYERFSGPLYALLHKMLQNKEDADEVLQTVFLQVWRKAGSYQPDRCAVFTWLVLVTRSKAIDRIRQRQRQNRTVDAVTLESSIGEQFATTESGGVEQHESHAFVRKALEGIPLEQRQAIEMAFFKGLSQAEISTALSQPLGTIKARIRRGMLRLRDHLVRRE